MNECLDTRVLRSRPLTRRQFIETTAAAGLLGILACRQAPVFAQNVT